MGMATVFGASTGYTGTGDEWPTDSTCAGSNNYPRSDPVEEEDEEECEDEPDPIEYDEPEILKSQVEYSDIWNPP